MFNRKNLFLSLTEIPPMKVSTGDSSSTLAATGLRTVKLICHKRPLILENCLFVPEVNCNLVSLLQLFKEKLVINWCRHHFTLESRGLNIVRGSIINNLMKVKYSTPQAFLSQVSLNHWHQRLGHPGPSIPRSMGLPIDVINCPTCDLNKAHLLPLKSHLEHITSFLKNKSDAFKEFLQEKTSMENLYDRKLKRLVSDRGGKFLNHKFKALSEEHRFQHITLPAETPQPNQFSERENQSIFVKTRCILKHYKLPKVYWAEAIRAATVLSNIVPTLSRNNKIPFSLWRGLSPWLKNIQTFVFKAIISLQKGHREWKFGPSGSEGILLGF
ncbi:hypothetical protein O181_126082 [Austropuccinia psidii MF-1]|uniref:Integrase catalytic domain-containing protein n=1 Tax=Austropuccinia psidii MF-1 TaxID=1389203 RepID=A0A9Q3KV84_9BASI|nr:hypothetical protein [Austropuccinia psidii MF-1]